MEFQHKSVLLQESIEGLNIKPNGIYVDGTLGGGGHSLEICKLLSSNGKLIGIDQDINAIEAATKRLCLYKDNISIIQDNFYNTKNILKNLNINKIDGMLLDLGVSSHQLDEAERGFSYMNEAKLDMRMNTENEISAYDIINFYEEEELTKIFYKYGEERWAKRISQFIVKERIYKPIVTTFELVNVIKKAIPKSAREDSHPAKKVFQAIRIEVNNELEIIENTIIDVVNTLNNYGRLVIITFHSLEDRIVKNVFKQLESPCICPRDFPICMCNKKQQVKIVNRKPIVATATELQNNRRARSAKLRIVEKLGD